MSNFYPSGFPHIAGGAVELNTDLSSQQPQAGPGPFEPLGANAGNWINSTGQTSVEEATPTPRRRRPSGTGHIKHRRTRNGCYTCRSRRVKVIALAPVDMRLDPLMKDYRFSVMRYDPNASVRVALRARPAELQLTALWILGCQKGSRDCTYPESRTTPSNSSASKRERSGTTAEDSDPSPDEDNPTETPLLEGRRGQNIKSEKPASETSKSSKGSHSSIVSTRGTATSPAEQPRPSIEQVKQESDLSPSTEASSTPASTGLDKPAKFSSVSTEPPQDSKPWSQLSPDLQYYLEYHKNHLTSHHWFFKHDANHFLHTILVELALHYDPLLYAIVGFAAFQSTLTRPDGKIQDFLGYYNKSVSLLRKSLYNNERHTDATMLTILQLATFEDYLGDFVSLLGHQKAAYGMLTELYSPQTIMETEVRRKMLVWYIRFDVMGGLLSGYETVLSRDWFLAKERYYSQQSSIYPMSIDYKIEAMIAKHRVLATDLTLLLAQLPRGDISADEFARESEGFSEQISSWRDNLDAVFADEAYQVTYFGNQKPNSDDVVDPYLPGGLYKGPLFTFNLMLIDWHAINLIHQYKAATLLNRRPPPEVGAIALEICRICEAIEYWPDSPAGAFLNTQGSLGLAANFLPRDQKHIMWCRRKFAKVESLGHIYPPTFRQQLAQAWGLPELNQSWLPEEEVCPQIVRSIHSFMENRLPQPEGRSRGEDQQNMKGLFSKLRIEEESSSPKTASTLTEEKGFAQSLVGPEIDFNMDSDDSMLDQSRESFYNMAVGDV